MIKLFCSGLFSSKKMEPLPLHDKKAEGIFITSTEDERSASDCKRHKNVLKSRRCAICVNMFFIVMLCISLSCNVVFVVSVIQRRFQDLTQCDAELQVNEVCLGCKYFEDSAKFLRLKNIVAYKRRRGKAEEVEDICCFEYNESLHEMSKTFLLEHMSADSFTTNDSQKRPAAHLTLDQLAISESGKRLRWNPGVEENDTAFMKHVQYADDKLVIQEEGTYYVYSFITFRSEHINNDTFLNHYVYRTTHQQGQSIKKAEMLFMDKQMRQSGNLEYQTSFLAGIVNMKSRDRIFTDVSDINAVYRSSLTNYIGLFKL